MRRLCSSTAPVRCQACSKPHPWVCAWSLKVGSDGILQFRSIPNALWICHLGGIHISNSLARDWRYRKINLILRQVSITVGRNWALQRDDANAGRDLGSGITDKSRLAGEILELQFYNLTIDAVQICIYHVLQLPPASGDHCGSSFP